MRLSRNSCYVCRASSQSREKSPSLVARVTNFGLTSASRQEYPDRALSALYCYNHVEVLAASRTNRREYLGHVCNGLCSCRSRLISIFPAKETLTTFWNDDLTSQTRRSQLTCSLPTEHQDRRQRGIAQSSNPQLISCGRRKSAVQPGDWTAGKTPTWFWLRQ